MSPHLHYFKVSFANSNAMHDAAEMIQRHAEGNPMLLISEPPLVLWTDGDIFSGASLYITKPALELMPKLKPLRITSIEAEEIPADAHLIVGDDRHRRERLPGTIH